MAKNIIEHEVTQKLSSAAKDLGATIGNLGASFMGRRQEEVKTQIGGDQLNFSDDEQEGNSWQQHQKPTASRPKSPDHTQPSSSEVPT